MLRILKKSNLFLENVFFMRPYKDATSSIVSMTATSIIKDIDTGEPIVIAIDFLIDNIIKNVLAKSDEETLNS